MYALSRSATLAASRPPTITAVVPNSSARSSARWISSRRVRLPPDGQLLGPRRLEGPEGRVERRLRAAVLLGEGVELLEMVGVEHGLAEVGDRAHQHAGIGVLGGPGLPRRPIRRRPWPGVGPGCGRLGPGSRPPAGSNGGAGLMCRATGAATIASRRGRPLRLTRALWPVAMAPAGAERKSVKPSRRRGSARPSLRSSAPATSNSGVRPAAVVGRRRGQGRLGQVDRPAAAGRRPLDPGPLADGRVQVDEPGIDDQALALDRLGVVRDGDVLVGPDRLDHPAPDARRSPARRPSPARRRPSPPGWRRPPG